MSLVLYSNSQQHLLRLHYYDRNLRIVTVNSDEITIWNGLWTHRWSDIESVHSL